MADAVKVVTTIAFTPSGGMPQGQAWNCLAALTTTGTLQTFTVSVAAGTPVNVSVPGTRMVCVVIDSANPQPVTISCTYLNLVYSITYTQSSSVTTGCPYLGPWFTDASVMRLTNTGTGTTNVRIFVWGT